MAARDILTLQTDIAPRLIRIVYALALIIITLGMLAGVARGITRMVHPAQNRTAMMARRGAMGPGRMAQNQQRPAPAAQASAADAPPSATAPSAAPGTTSAQTPAPQDGMMGPRGMGMRDGMGMRGMMGHRRGMRGMMGHRMGMRGRFGGRPGLLGHLPPVAQGGLQILRALVMGAIGIMLARILAEVAAAMLATGVKARQA